MATDQGITRISLRKLPESVNGIGDECLVVLYGGSIGRKYDLYGEEILIGRDPLNHIVIEVDSVSRNHARIVSDGDRRYVEDLDSTNGTYVADQQISRGALRSGDLLRVGDVIFKYLAGQDIEAAYHEEIYRMTISDGLTSIANLRYLQEFLERELARSRRYGRDLSVILIDIDHFKAVNDSLGHLCGDYVLRELCQLLARRVRREELLARYGGEELLLVLPETTVEGAASYGERLRAMVEAHRFVFEGHTVAVTVSMGVAGFAANMARPRDLIRVADERLYHAKRNGRNRVVA
ncbi:MAG: GGDEF domain-containing protein [Deltaproteobacteria bacterium]|nr:GGDEF domain-containing protein [Deltaproteobacteria bacterium]MCB9788045.1 GGDEF domain-containing protein [Deltaproteobacteria bacterium]